MSREIENNVVQMSMDSRDFEKGVDSSIKSIDKLNEKLRFDDASDGFKDLEKYANSVNFDGLNKAISNINSVFTITGNLSKKIIDDIAGYFEQKIVGAVSKVRSTINYIMDSDLGIKKYEDYTNTVKIMTANLADADKAELKRRKSIGEEASELEYVESYIADIALYTDETSYSLNDMVDTMAKFAANNVGLKDSAAAMMGFANMAAVAGQNATTASQGMMQMSQAFSAGYIKYQDWMQAFSLKNIATKEAKEVFVKKALEIGTLDKTDIEKARKENGENWVNYFFTSDTLNQGWLRTSDVLVQGLQEYSKASDYILENIEKVGERVSVTDMLGWVEDFKKSGLSANEFAKKVGGGVKDVNALAEALKELSKEEYELSLKAFNAAQNATNFHEAIDAVRDAVGTKMLYALKYFIGDLDQARKLWTNFANSLWDVFAAPLDNALDGLERFNKEVYRTEEINGKLVEFTLYDDFWNNVGSLFTNIGDIFGTLMDKVRMIVGAFEEVEDGVKEPMSIISKYTYSFMENLTNSIGAMSDAVGRFVNSGLFETIVDIFGNVFKTIMNIRSITSKFLGATLGTLLKNISKPLKAIGDIILELSSRVESFTKRLNESETFNSIIKTISDITTKLIELGTYLIGSFGKIFIKIVDKVGELAGKLLKLLLPAIEEVIKFIETYLLPFIDDLIEGNGFLGETIQLIGECLEGIVPAIEEFVKSITGMSFKEIGDRFGSFVDGFISDVGRIGKEGFSVLGDFFKGTFDKNTKGSIADFFNVIKDADSVAEGAESAIRWTGDALSRPVDLIFNLLSVISGKDLSGIAKSITGFIHGITDTLADISPSVFDVLGNVVDLLLKMVGFVAKFVVESLKYLSGMSDTTGSKLLDAILDGFIKLFSAVVDIFAKVLESMSKLIKYMTPSIKAGFEFMGEVFGIFIEKVKEIFGIFRDVQEPSDFLRSIAKIAGIVVGILLLAKIASLIYKVITSLSVFKGAVGALTNSVSTVSTSLANFFDSLGGYSLPGLLRLITLLIFAIGYSLAQMVKAGQVLSDPENLKGALLAFGMMALLIMLVISSVKKLTTLQTKGFEELAKAEARKEAAKKKLEKLKKKHGSEAGSWFLSKKDKKDLGLDTDSLRKDAESQKETLKGVGTALIGMAVAVLAVSAAISILAKTSKKTSQEDIQAATAAIATTILVMALAVKLMKAVGSSEKTLNKQDGLKMKKEGVSYAGIAAALLSLAFAVSLITVPIVLLAMVSKHTKKSDMNKAILAVSIVLGLIGAIIAIVSKSKFKGGQAVGVVFIVLTLSTTVVAIAGAFAILALAIKLLNPNDQATLITMSKILIGMFAAISIIFIILTLNSKRFNVVQMVKQIGTFITMASIITALIGVVAVVVGVLSIVGKIGNLAGAVESLKMIAISVGALLVVFFVLAKLMKGSQVAAMANLAVTVALAVTSIAVISVLLAGLAVILSITKPTSMSDAFIVILEALGILAVVVVSMIALSKIMSRSARSIVQIISLVPVILMSLTVLQLVIADIILLTLAMKLLGNPENITGAIKLMIGIVVSLAGLMVAMIFISKLMGQNTHMFKAIASLVAMTLAISLLVGVLLALSMGATLMGSMDELGKGLVIVAKAVLLLMGALLAMSVIGRVGAPGIKVITKALAGLAIALGIITLAVAVFVLAGDKLAEWLKDKGDKIAENFKAIGMAAANIIYGLLQGINEVLPELLEALNKTIIIILQWLEAHVGEWAERLVAIIAELLVGIGNGIENNFGAIAEGITKIVLGIWHVIKQVVANFSNMFEKQLEQWFGDPQEKLNRELEDKERKHQVEMYEIRKRGAEMYQALLDAIEDREKNLKDTIDSYGLQDATGYITNTADIARAATNLAYAKNEVAKLDEATKNKALNYYGVDLNKSAKDARESNNLLGDYDENYDYRKMEKMADKAADTYTNELNERVKENEGISSPSSVFEWIGKMLTAGLTKGANGEGAGESYAGGIINGFKEKIGGVTDAFASESSAGGLLNSITNSGTQAGSLFGSNMISGFTNSMSDFDFSVSAMNGMSADSLGMTGVIDMDDMINANSSGFDYSANLETSITDNQLNQLSDASHSDNEQVVNRLAAIESKMEEYIGAIKNIQMVLNTGVLVGEMVVPMDQALGERSSLRERRGI